MSGIVEAIRVTWIRKSRSVRTEENLSSSSFSELRNLERNGSLGFFLFAESITIETPRNELRLNGFTYAAPKGLDQLWLRVVLYGAAQRHKSLRPGRINRGHDSLGMFRYAEKQIPTTRPEVFRSYVHLPSSWVDGARILFSLKLPVHKSNHPEVA